MNLECLYDKIKDFDDVIIIAGKKELLNKFIDEHNIDVQFVNSRRFFKLKDKYIFLTNVEEGDKVHVYLLSRPSILNDLDMSELNNIVLDIDDFR